MYDFHRTCNTCCFKIINVPKDPAEKSIAASLMLPELPLGSIFQFIHNSEMDTNLNEGNDEIQITAQYRQRL
jgi:hypothetical protein